MSYKTNMDDIEPLNYDSAPSNTTYDAADNQATADLPAVIEPAVDPVDHLSDEELDAVDNEAGEDISDLEEVFSRFEVDAALGKGGLKVCDRAQLDWSGLSPEQQEDVCDSADEIHSLRRENGVGMIKIGMLLNSVKVTLGHGKFIPWLRAEFEWSPRTANRFMSYADKLSYAGELVGSLPKATLDKLVSEDTPEQARKELVKDIEAGTVASWQVADRINQAQKDARQAREGARKAKALAEEAPTQKEKRERREQASAQAVVTRKANEEAEVERRRAEIEKENTERQRESEKERANSVREIGELVALVATKFGADFEAFQQRLDGVDVWSFMEALRRYQCGETATPVAQNGNMITLPAKAA